jgi:DNA-binding winged helix-turn-helix (wHTH) protein
MDRPQGPTTRIGDVTVDFGKGRSHRSRWRAQQPGGKGGLILRLLVERAGEVVSRDEILERVWGYEVSPSTRTVEHMVVRLRKLIEPDPERPRYLHTVRGLGYRFSPEGEGMSDLRSISAEMLARYDSAGPRYTSYPTAVEFREDFQEPDYLRALERADACGAAPLSVYTHLPFCERRCTFCGCHSFATTRREVAEPYLQHLLREFDLGRRAPAPPTQGRAVSPGRRHAHVLFADAARTPGGRLCPPL